MLGLGFTQIYLDIGSMKMEYQRLGHSALKVSRLAFGCMSLGTEQQANTRILHQAFDAGINLFDTADLYDQGQNEASLGKALQDRRQHVYLATKVGNQWRADGSGWDWNPRKAYILKAVEASLRRLKTDYIDLYQLHGGTIEDPIDECIEAFEILKDKGTIRAYGLSSIRPNVINAYLKRSDIVSVMTQYSLLDKRPEESTLSSIHQAGAGVVVRGAIAKGLLVNKTANPYLDHSARGVAQAQHLVQEMADGSLKPAHLALQYVWAHQAVSCIVVGASHTDQLTENLAALGNIPSVAQLARLKEEIPAYRYQNHRT